MKFRVEYTKKAIRDLKSLTVNQKKQIVQETIRLEEGPFPYKNKVKKIQGMKFPCYRLRVDTETDSFRVFFGIDSQIIFVLGIVAKKDSAKILKNFKHLGFPPDIVTD